MSVNLSVLDPLRMDHRLVWATTNTPYEGWVAAGKPCLRQNCGHNRGSHIPSEGMECSDATAWGCRLRSSWRFGGHTRHQKPETSENGAVAHSLMHN
jgi:hypothetical protein